MTVAAQVTTVSATVGGNPGKVSKLGAKHAWTAVVTLAALLAVILAGGIDSRRPEFGDWDLHSYKAMAEAAPSIRGDVPDPYAHRLLGPYIAGLLPLPTDLAFRVLNSAAAILLGVLMYEFLLALGIRDSVAALTTVLFLLNRYAFQWLAWDYFQVDDTLTCVLLVLMFQSLLGGKRVQFALWLALGAATRETALLMIPIALFHSAAQRRVEGERAKLGRWLLVCIPGMLVFLLLRWLVRAQQGGAGYYWEALGDSAKFWASPEVLFRRVIWVWAPFSFAPLVFPRETMEFIQQNKSLSLLYPLVLLSTTFDGGYSGNNERLVAPAFVAFFALLATLIQRRMGLNVTRTGLLLLAALLCAMHHAYGWFPLPGKTYTLWLSATGFATATGTAAYSKLHADRPAPR